MITTRKCTQIVLLSKIDEGHIHILILSARFLSVSVFVIVVAMIPSAVTADVLAGIEEKCRMVGMVDYMSKPIKKHSLVKVLRNVAKMLNPFK